MIIDIYKSATCGDKYLSVQKGTKVLQLDLPDTVDADLQTLSPFKTRLEIDPAKPHKALDQKDIITQIEKNGFAVHGAIRVIKVGSEKADSDK